MGQVYTSKQLIKMITEDGWYLVRTGPGDHRQYNHPTKPGTVTIDHPVKDVPKKTANSVLKQAGLK